jgi:hypothetical protein
MSKNTDKIKTIFWIRHVFEKLELGHPEELLINSSKASKAETKLNSIFKEIAENLDSEAKKKELETFYTHVLEIFCNKDLLIEYWEGTKVPQCSTKQDVVNVPLTENNQGYTWTVNLVDIFVPGSIKYFNNGPYCLFEIMECEEFEDAVDAFTDGVKSAFITNKLSVDYLVTSSFKCEKTNKMINKINDIETCRWEEIEPLLGVYAEENFQILLKFIPNIFDQEWTYKNDYQLFLLLGAAYIQAKYDRKNDAIYSVSMFEIQEKRTPSLLYLEKAYKIDRFWWFENKYFEKSRQQMCYTHKSVFPNQIGEFLLDDEK